MPAASVLSGAHGHITAAPPLSVVLGASPSPGNQEKRRDDWSAGPNPSARRSAAAPALPLRLERPCRLHRRIRFQHKWCVRARLPGGIQRLVGRLPRRSCPLPLLGGSSVLPRRLAGRALGSRLCLRLPPSGDGRPTAAAAEASAAAWRELAMPGTAPASATGGHSTGAGRGAAAFFGGCEDGVAGPCCSASRSRCSLSLFSRRSLSIHACISSM